jgi:hypothetical protein
MAAKRSSASGVTLQFDAHQISCDSLMISSRVMTLSFLQFQTLRGCQRCDGQQSSILHQGLGYTSNPH